MRSRLRSCAQPSRCNGTRRRPRSWKRLDSPPSSRSSPRHGNATRSSLTRTGTFAQRLRGPTAAVASTGATGATGAVGTEGAMGTMATASPTRRLRAGDGDGERRPRPPRHAPQRQSEGVMSAVLGVKSRHSGASASESIRDSTVPGIAQVTISSMIRRQRRSRCACPRTCPRASRCS